MPDRDVLFLLRPGFRDPAQGDGTFVCPDSTLVEGLLSFYPQLREQLEIHYVDFPRPRDPIVALLGAEHQGCPVLVVARQGEDVADLLRRSDATGRAFVADGRPIARYLHRRMGVGDLHP